MPTYALLPLKAQEASLEHKNYERLARAHLNGNGFREVELGKAEVVVVLQYGLDEGREVVSSYPIVGRTGTSSSYTSGTIQSYGGGYATYSGTTTSVPTYGVVGSGVRSYIVFSRFLRVDIVDRAAL